MKMLLAIINSDDAHSVMNHLMEAGFQITKLATTGGFLRAGNVTILIGLQIWALASIRQCRSRSRSAARPYSC